MLAHDHKDGGIRRKFSVPTMVPNLPFSTHSQAHKGRQIRLFPYERPDTEKQEGHPWYEVSLGYRVRP